MTYRRPCVCLIASLFISAPALAKTETLTERGQRMCAEAGVPLEDCTILPPALRNGGASDVATVIPEARPLGGAAGTAPFGTGKYGWCADCTSLLAAAPVTPWSAFGGRENRQQRDEDSRESVASADPGSSGADNGGGGDNGDGGGSGNGGGDNGDGGGDGGNGGDNGDGGGDNGGICR